MDTIRPTTFKAAALKESALKSDTLRFAAVFLTSILSLILSSHASAAKVLQSDIQDQSSVSITIYNENLALIKDSRNLTLPSGEQTLSIRGVSGQLRPETALLRNTNGSPLTIHEQNFDFDLLTPQKLLEKYTGKNIRIASINPATGKETTENAKVLSTHNGTVVKIGDRIEINPTGRFIFDDVPANLRDQPTLSVVLNNDNIKKQTLQLSYLTGGLSWQADYVAELNKNDDHLDLTGWVTLNNTSGTDYNNAKLQLVAGDVNIVRQRVQKFQRGRGEVMEMAMSDASMSEESLFEYHLYSLGRKTTILNKQKKQVSLLSANNIAVKKELVLNGSNHYYHSQVRTIGQKLKFGVYVQIDNEKGNGLGLALPKGVVRVYKRDSNDNLQFIGEDRIDHTPNKDKIRLKLGDAFDVVANKTQTDFKINDRIIAKRIYESSYEIEVTNGKKETTEVVVREPIPGDWNITSESAQHKKVASNMVEWKLTVPAEGKVTLKYSTRVKY